MYRVDGMRHWNILKRKWGFYIAIVKGFILTLYLYNSLGIGKSIFLRWASRRFDSSRWKTNLPWQTFYNFLNFQFSKSTFIRVLQSNKISFTYLLRRRITFESILNRLIFFKPTIIIVLNGTVFQYLLLRHDQHD